MGIAPCRAGSAGRYERFLDFRVTSRIVPHKFLVWVHDRYMGGRNKLRDFLVNHMPSLYLELRMLPAP